MSEPPAETVARLAAAAGMPLRPDRCGELAPLFAMLRGRHEHLRSADVAHHEPLGPGTSPDRRNG